MRLSRALPLGLVLVLVAGVGVWALLRPSPEDGDGPGAPGLSAPPAEGPSAGSPASGSAPRPVPRFTLPRGDDPRAPSATRSPSGREFDRFLEATRPRGQDRLFGRPTASERSALQKEAARRAAEAVGLSAEETAKIEEIHARAADRHPPSPNDDKVPGRALQRAMQARATAIYEIRSLLGPDRYEQYRAALLQAGRQLGDVHLDRPAPLRRAPEP